MRNPAVCKHPIGFKPLTEREILARNDVTFCLQLAALYADEGNIDSAVFCCRTRTSRHPQCVTPTRTQRPTDDLLFFSFRGPCHGGSRPVTSKYLYFFPPFFNSDRATSWKVPGVLIWQRSTRLKHYCSIVEPSVLVRRTVNPNAFVGCFWSPFCQFNQQSFGFLSGPQFWQRSNR